MSQQGEEFRRSLIPQELYRRIQLRKPRQPEEANLLPPVDFDLQAAMTSLIPAKVSRPDDSMNRRRMADQVVMLRHQFRGQPEICMIHALAISYLRRETPHESHANQIFRRIWAEAEGFMVETLASRWLVSALQTFFDHGETEAERQAGGMFYVYANLIKAYESEMATRQPAKVERLKPRHFRNVTFPTLFGFTPGDDLLCNLNAVMLMCAEGGGLAAPAAREFLRRTVAADVIFQRVDGLHTHPNFRERDNYTFSFLGGKKRGAF